MIGYACSNITLQKLYGITPARTCRISTLLKQNNPINYCVELAKQNLKDTLKILKWNKEHDIFMYRISASMFPFATYKEYSWSLDYVDKEITELGKYIKENNMRVSSHLPQFINLASPKNDIVHKSIKDIEFHTNFFDRMGIGSIGKIIIHCGGVYNNRKKTQERFINTYNSLSQNIKNRLVVENDEKSWTIKQIMNIYKQTKLTVLIDNLHWQINHEDNSTWEEDLNLTLSTWNEKPKIHYSEQDPNKNTGAHSYFIEKIIKSDSFDTMVEAKGKEKAILPFITENYSFCKI